MLCTPTICSIVIAKILIDDGAGLYVPSAEAFTLLHVPLERLCPSNPFSRVGSSSSNPLG